MGLIKSVCVYCGSGLGRDPRHEAAALSLGEDLAKNKVGLVYGGGGMGLMGTVAKSVLEHGGHVTGIIPDFLQNREFMLKEAQEHIVTKDMHERKRLMFEKADAFVALPGGIGTLEELVEQLTWAQLGQHKKPIMIANIGGYWEPLLSMLEHMTAHSFIRETLWVPYLIADRIEDVLPELEKAAQDILEAGERPKKTVAGTPLGKM
ncbi:TIGR00730 family Rossman fold protein [Terrihabitans soli]|uniref:LOG family protein n=1 Tax=Terrihabitans soli TaxID=708113 RepID=UPI001CA382E9|nr:TIGR00730 family Rossman fold protein [Terrihabitans soli]